MTLNNSSECEISEELGYRCKRFNPIQRCNYFMDINSQIDLVTVITKLPKKNIKNSIQFLPLRRKNVNPMIETQSIEAKFGNNYDRKNVDINCLYKQLSFSWFFILRLDDAMHFGEAMMLEKNSIFFEACQFFSCNNHRLTALAQGNTSDYQSTIPLHYFLLNNPNEKKIVLNYIQKRKLDNLLQKGTYPDSKNLLFFSYLKSYYTLLKDYFELNNLYNNLQSKKSNIVSSIPKPCDSCQSLKDELEKLKHDYNKLLKDYKFCKNEKDKMVIKYATSEKQIIDAQRAQKQAEKKFHDIQKENSILQKKTAKAQEDLNKKCGEFHQLKAQLEQVKEESVMKETKLKWSETKLRFTLDNQKDTQAKLKEASGKILELTKESDKLKAEILDWQKKYQKVEENKITDQQIKEQQAKLILDRHLVEESESERIRLKKELEVSTDKQESSKKENCLLISKIQDLERECSNLKSCLDKAISLSQQQKLEIARLNEETLQMETLNKEVEYKEIQINSLENEIKEIILEKDDLRNDLQGYRQREPELINMTKNLANKLETIQVEYDNVVVKFHALEKNHDPLQKQLDECINRLKTLEAKLDNEQTERKNEREILTKYIAEQIILNETMFHKLEESKGETAILKKKYDLKIRELSKELNSCRTRLSSTTYETKETSESICT